MAQHSKLRAAVSAGIAAIFALTIVVSYTGTTADAALEFSDDDGSVHEPAIEALAAAGVTYGCGDGAFCPDRALSRAEAASLFVRALSLPAAPDAGPFMDVAGSAHAADIAALAAAGITKGCETTRFCPDTAVSRAELAVLIDRAFGLDPSGTDTFADDDGLRSEPAIEALVAAGITNGCQSWLFCPASRVTRAEAASFLARSLKLNVRETSDPGGATTTTTAESGSTTTTSIPSSTTTTVASPPVAVPAGAIQVPVGASIGSLIGSNASGAAFVFAPGTHIVGKVYPKDGQQFFGGPGVIISGAGTHSVSFSGDATGVVVDGFVFEDYANSAQFGVIHTGGRDWIIRNNEFRYNNGAGVSIASGFQLINNYIHHNGQIGIVSSNAVGAVVVGNEISYNNYQDAYEMAWEAGGAKFVKSTDLVVRDNYVHNNHGPGLWTDGSNLRTVYENNRVIDNHGPGIFHEISYDATIRNNYVEGNAFEFYSGGILVTESSNVVVSGNTLVNNDGGVVAIDTNRGSGTQGVWDLKNLRVTGNSMTYSSGWTGIRDNIGDGRVYQDGNVFQGNVYNVDTSAARWFWNNTAINFAAWSAAGMS